LAFNPRTDDIREAPSLVLIDQLLRAGATISAHDPVAMDNVQQLYGDRLLYAPQPMAALERADALAINTEWSEFRNPDFSDMRQQMAQPIIFDGRNLYGPTQLKGSGFLYYSIGRPPYSN